MIRRFVLAGVAGVLTLAACSDGNPDTTPRVEFAVSTNPVVIAAPGLVRPTGFAPEVYGDASGDTLTIDSVFMVVRKLELKRTMAVACDSMSSSDDGCEELELGPFLLDLPLGVAGADRQFTVPIDTGTYTKVEFEIHRAELGDTAFLNAHPGYNGVSIRVVGRWNGTPFVYTTSLDVEQETQFTTPIVVADGPTSFTLNVDIGAWFRNGADLVDPATALNGQPNQGLVEENIKQSFQAFEDGDHDGQED